jgi:chemotaxis response regulator CheB
MRELILATVAGQPDIEVVGETSDENSITECVERTRPDFLVIALDDPREQPGLCGFLLGRHPEMKILAVSRDANTSIFYRAFVNIHSEHVENSEEGLLNALRSEVGEQSVPSSRLH